MRKRTRQTKRPDDQHAILVRLPVKQHRALKSAADGERRSVNNAVVVAIDEYIAARKPHLTVVPDPPEEAA